MQIVDSNAFCNPIRFYVVYKYKIILFKRIGVENASFLPLNTTVFHTIFKRRDVSPVSPTTIPYIGELQYEFTGCPPRFCP